MNHGTEKAEEVYRQLAESLGQHSALVDCQDEIKRAIAEAYSDGLSVSVERGFAALSDDERAEVVSDYCRSCWCHDPRCQCSNDE